MKKLLIICATGFLIVVMVNYNKKSEGIATKPAAIEQENIKHKDCFKNIQRQQVDISAKTYTSGCS